MEIDTSVASVSVFEEIRDQQEGCLRCCEPTTAPGF